LFAKYRFN
jgi:hypothetical protein